MAFLGSAYKIQDPAGHWEFPDGSYQPVANAPRWGERLTKRLLYGLKWKPYQRSNAAHGASKESK